VKLASNRTARDLFSVLLPKLVWQLKKPSDCAFVLELVVQFVLAGSLTETYLTV